MDVLFAGRRIRRQEVGFHVMAFHLLEDFVRAALVFVLEVESGVDKVFALQRADAVLPAESGEDGAVVKGGLAIEIELGGPPGGGAVFELGPEGVGGVSGALGAERGEVFDLKIARLLEVMVVSNDVGTFLGVERGREEQQKTKQQEVENSRPKVREHEFSLQMICNNRQKTNLVPIFFASNLQLGLSAPTFIPSPQLFVACSSVVGSCKEDSYSQSV